MDHVCSLAFSISERQVTVRPNTMQQLERQGNVLHRPSHCTIAHKQQRPRRVYAMRGQAACAG